MKTTITTLAAMLAATTAMADLSARNDGITHQIMCSNVPAQAGSVPGFFAPNLGYFVEAAYADSVTTSYLGGVMPAGLSAKDSRDVEAFLTSLGLTNYELVIRDRERERIVEEVLPRGVASGQIPTGDNLTSMGTAASDGATILRVRSTIQQDVSIRKAGGGTEVVSVGAGDTLVAVDGGGTYIATFLGTHVSKTKATGPQAFNDLTEVAQAFTRNGRWCR